MITDILKKHVEAVPGKDAGVCCICQAETDQGHAENPSSCFTASAMFRSGPVICEWCWGIFKSPKMRRYNWLATHESIEFIGRDKDQRARLWSIIEHPPSIPYVLYLTTSGQKCGWLSGLQAMNSGTNQRILIVTDLYDGVVAIPSERKIKWMQLIERMRERGMTKAELSAGGSMKRWETAIKEGWQNELKEAESARGNPGWEVLVNVCV